MAKKKAKKKSPEMTIMEKIKAKIAEIRDLKGQIAANRDELRFAMDDAGELLDDLASAEDEIRHGLDEIESAIDTISETV